MSRDRSTDGTHKRWTSYYTRKVTFVLMTHEHKILLVPSAMKLRIKSQEYDHNVYEGPIAETRRTLTKEHQLLDLVGVLYADQQRDFLGQIGWLVEDDRKATSAVRRGASQSPTLQS